MQGGKGSFDSLCHGIYFALLGNVLTTGNGIDGGFHSGEILVVILLQSICLGEGCIDLGVVGVLVLQGSNRIFDSFRHYINFALFSDVLVTDNSIDSGFHSREILVVILLQSLCLGNGCIDLGVVGILVLQDGNGSLDSLCHCINLCLMGFTFRSVNSINGIFYRRIICIKATIKSRCTFDGCINSCVISENVIVIPHKSWMADSGNPLNARTGIVFQASKDICGGKVCDGSTFSMRERRRAIFRVIRPIAIFYCAAEGISHPISISTFICAHVGRRNHTVLDCNIGISNASANRVIDSCNTSNDSANSGLNGVDNNLTIKPAIRNS